MTEPHHAVIVRLQSEFATMSQQFARMAADMAQLDRLLVERGSAPSSTGPVPQPGPMTPPVLPYWPQYPPQAGPAPVRRERRSAGESGWVGEALAVAGVAVTLTGVVLLLVLAAQAGLLQPGFRVAGGTALAVVLVALAYRLYTRPGGRVGAIALAATGIAAAYMDVIASTTIYRWLSAPVGLVLAAGIGALGLTLARRWNSEHLAVLVLVPLAVLAPVVADGITLLLVGFMLALSAATLRIQFGSDWVWMYAARTAAVTVPLLPALVGAGIGGGEDLALAGACVMAAVLALGGVLMLLPHSRHRAALAVLTGLGVLPMLCVSLAVDRVPAALMIGALAATLTAIVLLGDQLRGVPGIARQVFSVLAAVAALVAVTVAFAGELAAPALLAITVVVAVGGRRDAVARWVAIGFGAVGGALYLAYAPPGSLAWPSAVSRPDQVSILVSSLLLIGSAVAIAWAWAGSPADPGAQSRTGARLLWAAAAGVTGYAITAFAVTAGVLIGGTRTGFVVGHMAATLCWIAVAAALFGYAARHPRAQRSLPVGGGLVVGAAATAKLFLFDLGALDGMFRVTAFIVVGLALLAMGTGYARSLAQRQPKV